MPTIRFDTFCAQVCSAIRWEPARRMARAELTAHLEDHAEALAAKGLAPDLAAEQAVAAMGDPYELGRALDRAHPPTLPRLSRVLALAGSLVLAAGLCLGIVRGTGLLALSGAFPRPPDLYEHAGQALLMEGISTGGGSLGGYTLAPSGQAGLVSYDRPDEDRREIMVPVTISADRPWLPVPSCYLDGTWTDGAGGACAASINSGWPYLFGAEGWLYLTAPTSGARQFTAAFTVGGEEVFFTVTLPEEVPPL